MNLMLMLFQLFLFLPRTKLFGNLAIKLAFIAKYWQHLSKIFNINFVLHTGSLGEA